jgi:hypothetical protein
LFHSSLAKTRQKLLPSGVGFDWSNFQEAFSPDKPIAEASMELTLVLWATGVCCLAALAMLCAKKKTKTAVNMNYLDEIPTMSSTMNSSRRRVVVLINPPLSS